MADVDDLFEVLVLEAAELAGAKFLREDFEGGELKGLLNLRNWFAMGRLAYAKAVIGEGRVAVLVNSRLGITIVVIICGEIPVAAVRQSLFRSC